MERHACPRSRPRAPPCSLLITYKIHKRQLVRVNLPRRAQGEGGRVVEVVAGRARWAGRGGERRQRDGPRVAAPPQQELTQGPTVRVGNEGERVVLDQLGGRAGRELGQDAGDQRVEGQGARRRGGVQARNVGVDGPGRQAGADGGEDEGGQAARKGLLQGAGGRGCEKSGARVDERVGVG